jgi:hypothetical protein
MIWEEVNAKYSIHFVASASADGMIRPAKWDMCG